MSNIYCIIISWREPWHKFEDWDWFNARNFCRLGETVCLSWQSQWQWHDNDHDHDNDNIEIGFFSQHLFQKTNFHQSMQGTRSSFLIQIFNMAVKTRCEIHKNKWLLHGNLRERCMDLVSFESPQEYRHFATMMYYGELLIWVGGKITL